MDEALTAGAMGRVPTPADSLSLRGAASALFDAGLEMDEATTAATFRATADSVNRAEAEGWMGPPYPPSSTRASR